MRTNIIKKLKSTDYSTASQALDELINNGKVSTEELSFILTLDNLLIIGEFLEKYKEFSTTDLQSIEIFINNNLENPDRLFVADLIEFATSWALSLDYNKCLEFLFPGYYDSMWRLTTSCTW